MNWVAQIPYEQLANSVLNADGLHAMQLVVFVIVVGWVVATWLNGRSLNQMSATQRGMSQTNERFLENDSRRTTAFEDMVKEVKSLNQNFTAGTLTQTEANAQILRTAEKHDERNEARTRSILEQVSSGNKTTLEALQPALEGLNKIVMLGDAFSVQHEKTIEVLRKQHEEQLAALKAQGEAQGTAIRGAITEAQKVILETLKPPEKPRDTDILPPMSIYPAQPLAPLPPMVNGAVGPAALSGPDTNLDTRPERP